LSHYLEHARVICVTPSMFTKYRSYIIEAREVRPSFIGMNAALTASKYLYRPVEGVNMVIRVRSSRFKSVSGNALASAIHTLATSSIPYFLANYEPNWLGIAAYIEVSGGNSRIYAASLTLKKGMRISNSRISRSIDVFIVCDREGSIDPKKLASEWHRLVWSFIVSTLRASGKMVSQDHAPPPIRRYTIVLHLVPETKIEYVEVKVPEAHDVIVVKVPIKGPEWSLDDVPEKLKQDLETVIVNPIKQRAAYAPRGVMITGPPGVGKTVTAEAIAHKLGLRIAEIRPSIYRSMWYGMTEKILDGILRTLKKRSNILVLLDDVDYLLGRHVSIHETHISEITIMLRYLQEPKRPLVVMTTNAPELLDPAIVRPGRIDVVIVMGYPDREMRRRIALKCVERYGIRYDEKVIDTIVSITRWFTNAEIDALIRLAASKGGGKLDEESIMWARQKFNINEGMRRAIQDQLRWFGERFQGIILKYVPKESEI